MKLRVGIREAASRNYDSLSANDDGGNGVDGMCFSVRTPINGWAVLDRLCLDAAESPDLTESLRACAICGARTEHSNVRSTQLDPSAGAIHSDWFMRNARLCMCW